MAVGRKTGGRQKGTRNKAPSKAAIAETLATAINASDATPLDFMLAVMRDEQLEITARFDAAKAAAPYLHSKLATLQHTGPAGGPLQIIFTSEDAGLL